VAPAAGLAALLGFLLLWSLYAGIGWGLARLPSDGHSDVPAPRIEAGP